MTFLATYWWLFLIVTCICFGIAVALQLRNMRGIKQIPFDMMKNLNTDKWLNEDESDAGLFGFTSGMNDRYNGFLNGMLPVALFGLLGTGSGILFLIGVVVAIIQYAK